MEYFRVIIFVLSILINLGFSLLFTLKYFHVRKSFDSINSNDELKLSKRNEERWNRLIDQYRPFLNVKLFTNPTSIQSKKTLIYSCRNFCGGWGDRLRGILSVYFLSLISDRRFMIEMNYPCEISRTLLPNFYNWTWIKTNENQTRTRLMINTMASRNVKYRQTIVETISKMNFSQIWFSYDDIFITTNTDYLSLVLQNKIFSKKIQELFGHLPISNGKLSEIFPFFFEILFKPSSMVEQRVNSILSKSKEKHLICLHIRIGKNPTNPFDFAFKLRTNISKIIIDFTKKYLTNLNESSVIFVTADSSEAVHDVLTNFPRNSLTIAGPILHIDRFDRHKSTVCEGFIKVISDFYVLGECQSSILSPSGFSSWANRRRSNFKRNFYLFNENSQRFSGK